MIRHCAYTLFCEQGYAGTTMAQIAEAAGVAVQTVYFVFHTKAAVLRRSYEFAVGGEERVVPQQQPWYRAMTAEPDVTQAVRHLVTGVSEITRRVTPLYLVARVAADGDPDTARVVAFHEDWRAQGYREVLELLRAKAGLRPGLSLERATDLLLLFVGMDAYHVLVENRGWSHGSGSTGPFRRWRSSCSAAPPARREDRGVPVVGVARLKATVDRPSSGCGGGTPRPRHLCRRKPCWPNRTSGAPDRSRACGYPPGIRATEDVLGRRWSEG